MSYQPKPIDTSGVELPAKLVDLTERLAQNAHELWARQRLVDGWSYGPHRDDKLKKHPCLVPYDELSESEKAFDRQTATGTLKAILVLGYKIEEPRS